MRRAQPSSSISASAAVNWLAVATRTDRPSNSPSRPPRLVPRSSAVNCTSAVLSKKNAACGAFATGRAASASQCTPILVDFHEVAERHRKHGLLRGSERIDAKRIFKPRDQHSKAERVEAAFRQHQVVL